MARGETKHQWFEFSKEEIIIDYNKIQQLVKELRVIDHKYAIYDSGTGTWDSHSVLESQMENELGKRELIG